MNFLCDTSVLTPMVNVNHIHHERVVDKFSELTLAGHTAMLAPQSLYEFYVVASRPLGVNGLGLTPTLAYDYCLRFQHEMLLLPNNLLVLENWQKLVVMHRVSGRQAHDTRLVAWMQAHSVLHLFTLNTKDFERFVPSIFLV